MFYKERRPSPLQPHSIAMNDLFFRLARWASMLVAHPLAFAGALLAVILWAAAGPAFHYSANWQLVINTGTTILTFLMVFLLQHLQNRDSRAMPIKLDERLRAMHGARTELVDLENVTEAEHARYCEEFKTLHLRYAKLLAKRGGTIKAQAETAVFEDGETAGGKPAGKKPVTRP
jgi:low affinity Fe/Cu permease